MLKVSLDLAVASALILQIVRRDTAMEYTVKALAELAGVTPRTLRWYEIGRAHV